MARGELNREQLSRLEEVEIVEVRDDTVKNEEREKFEILEINTFQNEDDDGSGFQMRVIVELTDKQKEKYLVQFQGMRPGGLDSEYTGEDYWTLSMAYGELERLKVTGYLVQYGFVDEGHFKLVAEKDDDSEDMLEGVRAGTTHLFPGKVRLRHHYMFNDDSEGEQESSPENIRKMK